MVLASNEQRLLDAVYREPRADDARRVYADWFVGRGDPRGEFIHLQLDRARARATTEQFARERDLLERHHGAWVLPFHATDHVVFERGFVTRVALTPESVAHLLPGPLWSTVEELFVREPRHPIDPDVLAPLVDAPSMADLRRVAAPFAMLEALTASARRQWRGITLVDGQWLCNSLVGLSRRLPKLTTLGVFATDSKQIRGLCTRPPLLPRVRRLEVRWWDNAHYSDPFSSFFELVEGSTFDEFRWFNTSCHGELVLRRTGPGRYGVVEGDAHVIEDLDDPPVPTTFDEIRVYWTNNTDHDYFDGVRALAERTGATLEFEAIPRARVLPTPESEYV